MFVVFGLAEIEDHLPFGYVLLAVGVLNAVVFARRRTPPLADALPDALPDAQPDTSPPDSSRSA
jgi:hypothetical protein